MPIRRNSAIHLESIPYKLMLIIKLLGVEVIIIFVPAKHSLLSHITFRKHIQRYKIGKPVIIHIDGVSPHCIPTRVFEIILNVITESAIFIIYIQNVISDKIVAYV